MGKEIEEIVTAGIVRHVNLIALATIVRWFPTSVVFVTSSPTSLMVSQLVIILTAWLFTVIFSLANADFFVKKSDFPSACMMEKKFGKHRELTHRAQLKFSHFHGSYGG